MHFLNRSQEETSLRQSATKRVGDRRQQQVGDNTVEGSAKKKRKIETLEPKVISTRRSSSLASLPSDSPKKRPRTSTAASPRSANRQRR